MNKPSKDSLGLAVEGEKVCPSDGDRKEMVKILIQDALDDVDVTSTERFKANYR